MHIVLLSASLAVLPIVADPSWKPAGGEDPGRRILGLLLATIGLPYFLLATTGPLVQAWFARSFPQGTVYRLFALSNLASMLALISYPFAFETWVTTAVQAYGWSVGYAVFALLCGASALYGLRKDALSPVIAAAAADDTAAAPGKFDLFLWLALSAMGSWLLLAITNHITQNIASIPFLWLVPLTLYLLTFILCFERDGWYRRSLLLGPLAIILGFCAWGLQTTGVTLDLKVAIPLYLTGLFTCCMFFHGELARMRPRAAPPDVVLFDGLARRGARRHVRRPRRAAHLPDLLRARPGLCADRDARCHHAAQIAIFRVDRRRRGGRGLRLFLVQAGRGIEGRHARDGAQLLRHAAHPRRRP